MIDKLFTSRFWLPLLVYWGALAVLLLLQSLLTTLPSWTVMVAAGFLFLPIAYYLYEWGNRRRQAVLGVFLEKDGKARKLLRGRPFLMVKNGLSALLLTAIIIAALANIQPFYLWVTLVLWMPIWVALSLLLGGAIQKEVHCLGISGYTSAVAGW